MICCKGEFWLEYALWICVFDLLKAVALPSNWLGFFLDLGRYWILR
jgi:hypothetical protein